MLATRKGSPIRNIADLKGKTVGALLGGDPYNVLSQMLRFELGNADPKAHGITVVNTPTQAQAATIPTRHGCRDPDLSRVPQGRRRGRHRRHHELVRLHRGHYKGPAGKGAGHPARVGEEVAVLSRRLLPPPLVLDRPSEAHEERSRRSSSRSCMAQQDAVAKLSAMDTGGVSDLAQEILGARSQARLARWSSDDVLFARGWCWPTEGDATAVLEISKFMVEGKLIPKPLAWSQVRDAFAPAAGVLREAYEKTGSKPDAAAFAAIERQGPARLAGVGLREVERAHVIAPLRDMNVGFIGLGTMGGADGEERDEGRARADRVRRQRGGVARARRTPARAARDRRRTWRRRATSSSRCCPTRPTSSASRSARTASSKASRRARSTST